MGTPHSLNSDLWSSQRSDPVNNFNVHPKNDQLKACCNVLDVLAILYSEKNQWEQFILYIVDSASISHFRDHPQALSPLFHFVISMEKKKNTHTFA